MKERSKAFRGMTSYVSFLWDRQRGIFLLGIFYIAAYIPVNYLRVYLPKLVLSELEQQKGIWHLITAVTVLAVLLTLAIFIREKMGAQIEYRNRLAAQDIQKGYVQKLLNVDYGCLQDPEFSLLRSKVKEAIFGSSIGSEEYSGMLFEFSMKVMQMLALVGNVLLYIYYLGCLSLWLPVVYFPVYLLAGLFGKMTDRIEKKYSKGGSEAWQKLDYVTRKTQDFSMAKDVRLYQMQDWLEGLSGKFLGMRSFYKKRELQARGFQAVISALLLMVDNAFLFGFLLYRLYQGSITVSDFVFYAGIGSNFVYMLDDLLQSTQAIARLSLNFNRYQEYKAYGVDTGKLCVPIQGQAAEIILEHVSFQYPGAEDEVLSDLSLKVSAGEKIAIVGINGAGKTTLMKLICGLLRPTEGRILLNGRDLAEMEAEEIYAWFSCAFQDIRFLPLSIRENISMQLPENTDEERVWNCLEQAGMQKKIKGLEQGLDTLLEKNIHENAVDFSGGERQKMILARALYRNAGTLILDEPTAALDALAENEVYHRYAEYARGKTSFFVSHRLSSTRFCDRILLLDGGCVAEEGTHEELLEKRGKYYEMFCLQGKYYV